MGFTSRRVLKLGLLTFHGEIAFRRLAGWLQVFCKTAVLEAEQQS